MKKNIKKIIFGSFLSLSLFIGDIKVSAESKEQYLDSFLNNVYGIMLQRDPDEEGKNYWYNKIINQETGILNFINQILDQDEFDKLNVSAEDFITRNYKLLMDREPDEEGLKYWISKVSENSSKEEKLQIINEMAHSQEFMGKVNELGIVFKKFEDINTKEEENLTDMDVFVGDAYEHILGRGYDIDGLNYWKKELTSHNKGALDLINNFISTEEFKNKKMSDIDFIKAVYEVLFNRSADEEGLNYWNTIFQKDKSNNRYSNIVFNIADDSEFLSRIKNMKIILKKIDSNLFYSEYLTSKNKIRGITSKELAETKKDMTFFDIIVKLGRTKDVSSIKGINIAKYIVDGSKEMYFIFKNPQDNYGFDPMEVFKAQK